MLDEVRSPSLAVGARASQAASGSILALVGKADAKTADGKPTKRLIKVGVYKTEPNHVETKSGDIFYFAEPIETPAKMQGYNWL